jgi:hypothetical protein
MNAGFASRGRDVTISGKPCELHVSSGTPTRCVDRPRYRSSIHTACFLHPIRWKIHAVDFWSPIGDQSPGHEFVTVTKRAVPQGTPSELRPNPLSPSRDPALRPHPGVSEAATACPGRLRNARVLRPQFPRPEPSLSRSVRPKPSPAPAAGASFLPSRALPMRTPRPTAGPAHAFLELFAGATDAALAGLRFLRVLDPADELVAGQRRDVEPGRAGGVAGGESRGQVGGQLVDDAARKLRRFRRSSHPTRLPRPDGRGRPNRRYRWLRTTAAGAGR